MKKNRKELAQIVLSQLETEYPHVRTFLNHNNVFELLIATILSPQTNDETTNSVTPKLFERFPTPESLAKANFDEVLELIKKINFNKTKAQRLIDTAEVLLKQFNSKNVQYSIYK